MILQKMPHYVDSFLTQEDASAALQDGQVVVGLYTNRENVQSVVHSHPYYEMILPVAGSSVRYSVDGSVYDLHKNCWVLLCKFELLRSMRCCGILVLITE